MASLVGEVQNLWDFEGIEVQEIDGELLMSLLEEDDERLNRVIESLQAEISNPMIDDHDGSRSTMDQAEMGSSDGEVEVCDWSMRQGGVDFSWVDEMEMEVVPSSPSEDMNWYMDNYGNEMDVGLAEFGVVADYSLMCNGSIHLEGSLWQEESYDPLMYGSSVC